ncbi:uncharacterized protein LOC5514472 [Nematostella vectensis]|uniref:uncharacterized protein LOC5514472 n=1 Tax=Nematostella vectensis TaxID=45351 RepID=UPI002076F827|nr:uncharacterized protein LOC5514472 [Nematostella vectensis]XP_032239951.2 uncharacterized protein LOC5514472 [Nematostella vectensis]XP_032239952.2 uncharacterized protein LOC5514472 [Nematostella vectensis]
MPRLMTAWFLACVLFVSFSLGLSIICHVCDPLKDTECLPNSKTIDCKMDQELGHAFDSCYTLQLVFSDAMGNFTYEEKNCSIRDGCQDLRNSMCQNFNETSKGLVKSCKIDCCTGDFCNGGKPDFSKNYGKTTRYPGNFPTTKPQVLAISHGFGCRCSAPLWTVLLLIAALLFNEMS